MVEPQELTIILKADNTDALAKLSELKKAIADMPPGLLYRNWKEDFAAACLGAGLIAFGIWFGTLL
jgi:hypothetical protein